MVNVVHSTAEAAGGTYRHLQHPQLVSVLEQAERDLAELTAGGNGYAHSPDELEGVPALGRFDAR